jgi:hypothetical protein
MSLGYRRPEDMKIVLMGDTAELYAFPTPSAEYVADPLDIASGEFTVIAPDGTTDTLTATVNDDGGIFARFTDTTQVGSYRVLATATFSSGEVRSETFTFEVEDPLDPPPPTKHEEIADAVWLRFEDLFDSTEGGPWLRDMTLRYFDKRKIPAFIGDALMEINLAPPMTNATIIDFTTPVAVGNPDLDGPDLDQGILILATELAIIRHLMRSYVEQPALVGVQAGYEDRRDYLQRWQTIYEIDMEVFKRWLALWKRQFLGLGHSKILVSSKAGRLYGPTAQRTRNVSRGWY